MSQNFGNRLIVKLKVSVGLAAILIFLHAGAATLLFFLSIPAAVKVGLAAFVLASLYGSLQRHAFRRGFGAVTSLEQDANDAWYVRFNDTEAGRNAVVASRFVHRWMVLLSLRVAGRRLPVALAVAADATEPDLFRRLRVALLAPPRNPAA